MVCNVTPKSFTDPKEFERNLNKIDCLMFLNEFLKLVTK